jgi:hypothetical protein
MRALRILEGMALADVQSPNFVDDVYMVAHQAVSPACAKNHPDFAVRALKIEEEWK